MHGKFLTNSARGKVAMFSAVVVGLISTTALFAAQRCGPHGCVEGYCAPNHVWGYYATNWRRWPGADEESETSADRARSRTLPPPAFIVPSPTQEEADIPPKPPGATTPTPKTDTDPTTPGDAEKPKEDAPTAAPAEEKPATPPEEKANATATPDAPPTVAPKAADDAKSDEGPLAPKADDAKEEKAGEKSSGSKASSPPSLTWSAGRAVHDLSIHTPAVRQVSAEVLVASTAGSTRPVPVENPSALTTDATASGNPLRGGWSTRRETPKAQAVIELVPVPVAAPKKAAAQRSASGQILSVPVEATRNPLR